jgi:hypothetical protein
MLNSAYFISRIEDRETVGGQDHTEIDSWKGAGVFWRKWIEAVLPETRLKAPAEGQGQ